jgi:hypothetical protein
MAHTVIRTSQFIKLYNGYYLPIVKKGDGNWLDSKGNIAYEDQFLLFCNRDEYPKFVYSEQEILSFVEAEMQETIKNAKEKALQNNEKVPTDAEILEYYTSYHYFTVNSNDLYATSYDKYVNFLKKCIKDAICVEELITKYENFKSFEIKITNGSRILGEYKTYSIFIVDEKSINDDTKMLTETERLQWEIDSLVEYMKTGKANYYVRFKTTSFGDKLQKRKTEKPISDKKVSDKEQYVLTTYSDGRYYVKNTSTQVHLSRILEQAKIYNSEKVAKNKIEKLKKATKVDFVLYALV